MSFFEKRKRKNDDPPRFPAWILVLIAIGLVIVVVLFIQSTSRNSSAASQMTLPTIEDGAFDLTATYIINQATAMAQATPQPVSSNLDPIEQTATSIVKLATEQAKTPGS